MGRRAASRLLLTVALVAAAGGLVAPGVAATVWTRPVTLARSGDEVAVAANSVGEAVAVWTRDGAPVYAAFRDRLGSWADPTKIADASYQWAGEPAVVLDDDGRATVTWVGTNGGPHDVIANVFLVTVRGAPGRAWTAPRTLSRTAGWAAASLALGGDGTVTAAWAEWEGCMLLYPAGSPCAGYPEGGGKNVVKVASRPVGGPWSAPVTVADGTGPALAGASDGAQGLVWWDPAVESGGLLASTRQPGGPWTSPRRLSTREPLERARIVVSSAGDLVAAWTACDVTDGTRRCQVQVAERPASGTWGGEHALWAGEASGAPALAASGDGAVAAAWHLNGVDGRVVATRRLPGGTWEPSATVGTAPGRVSGLDVAGDDRGGTAAVWSHYDPDLEGSVVRAAVRPDGGTWQPPERLAVGTRPDAVATGPARFTVAYIRREHGVAYTDRVDDRTAPVARLVQPARAAVDGTSIRVAWRAYDTQAGSRRPTSGAEPPATREASATGSSGGGGPRTGRRCSRGARGGPPASRCAPRTVRATPAGGPGSAARAPRSTTGQPPSLAGGAESPEAGPTAGPRPSRTGPAHGLCSLGPRAGRSTCWPPPAPVAAGSACVSPASTWGRCPCAPRTCGTDGWSRSAPSLGCERAG